ncbi:unnamed protein product [Amoebophrya sp. A25]|nr:unnamed protein product [Amoebophrya sp. A25]|eukprot:GSA25T00006143001.1
MVKKSNGKSESKWARKKHTEQLQAAGVRAEATAGGGLVFTGVVHDDAPRYKLFSSEQQPHQNTTTAASSAAVGKAAASSSTNWSGHGVTHLHSSKVKTNKPKPGAASKASSSGGAGKAVRNYNTIPSLFGAGHATTAVPPVTTSIATGAEGGIAGTYITHQYVKPGAQPVQDKTTAYFHSFQNEILESGNADAGVVDAVIIDAPNVMRWTEEERNGKSTDDGNSKFLLLVIQEVRATYGPGVFIEVVTYRPTKEKLHRNDVTFREIEKMQRVAVIATPAGANVDDFILTSAIRTYTHPKSITEGHGDQLLQRCQWTEDAVLRARIVSNDRYKEFLSKISNSAMRKALSRALVKFVIKPGARGPQALLNMMGDDLPEEPDPEGEESAQPGGSRNKGKVRSQSAAVRKGGDGGAVGTQGKASSNSKRERSRTADSNSLKGGKVNKNKTQNVTDEKLQRRVDELKKGAKPGGERRMQLNNARTAYVVENDDDAVEEEDAGVLPEIRAAAAAAAERTGDALFAASMVTARSHLEGLSPRSVSYRSDDHVAQEGNTPSGADARATRSDALAAAAAQDILGIPSSTPGAGTRRRSVGIVSGRSGSSMAKRNLVDDPRDRDLRILGTSRKRRHDRKSKHSSSSKRRRYLSDRRDEERRRARREEHKRSRAHARSGTFVEQSADMSISPAEDIHRVSPDDADVSDERRTSVSSSSGQRRAGKNFPRIASRDLVLEHADILNTLSDNEQGDSGRSVEKLQPNLGTIAFGDGEVDLASPQLSPICLRAGTEDSVVAALEVTMREGDGEVPNKAGTRKEGHELQSVSDIMSNIDSNDESVLQRPGFRRRAAGGSDIKRKLVSKAPSWLIGPSSTAPGSGEKQAARIDEHKRENGADFSGRQVEATHHSRAGENHIAPATTTDAVDKIRPPPAQRDKNDSTSSGKRPPPATSSPTRDGRAIGRRFLDSELPIFSGEEHDHSLERRHNYSRLPSDLPRLEKVNYSSATGARRGTTRGPPVPPSDINSGQDGVNAINERRVLDTSMRLRVPQAQAQPHQHEQHQTPGAPSSATLSKDLGLAIGRANEQQESRGATSIMVRRDHAAPFDDLPKLSARSRATSNYMRHETASLLANDEDEIGRIHRVESLHCMANTGARPNKLFSSGAASSNEHENCRGGDRAMTRAVSALHHITNMDGRGTTTSSRGTMSARDEMPDHTHGNVFGTITTTIGGREGLGQSRLRRASSPRNIRDRYLPQERNAGQQSYTGALAAPPPQAQQGLSSASTSRTATARRIVRVSSLHDQEELFLSGSERRAPPPQHFSETAAVPASARGFTLGTTRRGSAFGTLSPLPSRADDLQNLAVSTRERREPRGDTSLLLLGEAARSKAHSRVASPFEHSSTSDHELAAFRFEHRMSESTAARMIPSASSSSTLLPNTLGHERSRLGGAVSNYSTGGSGMVRVQGDRNPSSASYGNLSFEQSYPVGGVASQMRASHRIDRPGQRSGVTKNIGQGDVLQRRSNIDHYYRRMDAPSTITGEANQRRTRAQTLADEEEDRHIERVLEEKAALFAPRPRAKRQDESTEQSLAIPLNAVLTPGRDVIRPNRDGNLLLQQDHARGIRHESDSTSMAAPARKRSMIGRASEHQRGSPRISLVFQEDILMEQQTKTGEKRERQGAEVQLFSQAQPQRGGAQIEVPQERMPLLPGPLQETSARAGVFASRLDTDPLVRGHETRTPADAPVLRQGGEGGREGSTCIIAPLEPASNNESMRTNLRGRQKSLDRSEPAERKEYESHEDPRKSKRRSLGQESETHRTRQKEAVPGANDVSRSSPQDRVDILRVVEQQASQEHVKFSSSGDHFSPPAGKQRSSVIDRQGRQDAAETPPASAAKTLTKHVEQQEQENYTNRAPTAFIGAPGAVRSRAASMSEFELDSSISPSKEPEDKRRERSNLQKAANRRRMNRAPSDEGCPPRPSSGTLKTIIADNIQIFTGGTVLGSPTPSSSDMNEDADHSASGQPRQAAPLQPSPPTTTRSIDNESLRRRLEELKKKMGHLLVERGGAIEDIRADREVPVSAERPPMERSESARDESSQRPVKKAKLVASSEAGGLVSAGAAASDVASRSSVEAPLQQARESPPISSPSSSSAMLSRGTVIASSRKNATDHVKRGTTNIATSGNAASSSKSGSLRASNESNLQVGVSSVLAGAKELPRSVGPPPGMSGNAPGSAGSSSCARGELILVASSRPVMAPADPSPSGKQVGSTGHGQPAPGAGAVPAVRGDVGQRSANRERIEGHAHADIPRSTADEKQCEGARSSSAEKGLGREQPEQKRVAMGEDGNSEGDIDLDSDDEKEDEDAQAEGQISAKRPLGFEGRSGSRDDNDGPDNFGGGRPFLRSAATGKVTSSSTADLNTSATEKGTGRTSGTTTGGKQHGREPGVNCDSPCTTTPPRCRGSVAVNQQETGFHNTGSAFTPRDSQKESATLQLEKNLTGQKYHGGGAPKKKGYLACPNSQTCETTWRTANQYSGKAEQTQTNTGEASGAPSASENNVIIGVVEHGVEVDILGVAGTAARCAQDGAATDRDRHVDNGADPAAAPAGYQGSWAFETRDAASEAYSPSSQALCLSCGSAVGRRMPGDHRIRQMQQEDERGVIVMDGEPVQISQSSSASLSASRKVGILTRAECRNAIATLCPDSDLVSSYKRDFMDSDVTDHGGNRDEQEQGTCSSSALGEYMAFLDLFPEAAEKLHGIGDEANMAFRSENDWAQRPINTRNRARQAALSITEVGHSNYPGAASSDDEFDDHREEGQERMKRCLQKIDDDLEMMNKSGEATGSSTRRTTTTRSPHSEEQEELDEDHHINCGMLIDRRPRPRRAVDSSTLVEGEKRRLDHQSLPNLTLLAAGCGGRTLKSMLERLAAGFSSSGGDETCVAVENVILSGSYDIARCCYDDAVEYAPHEQEEQEERPRSLSFSDGGEGSCDERKPQNNNKAVAGLSRSSSSKSFVFPPLLPSDEEIRVRRERFKAEFYAWLQWDFSEEVQRRAGESSTPRPRLSATPIGTAAGTSEGRKCLLIEGLPPRLTMADRAYLCSLVNAQVVALLLPGGANSSRQSNALEKKQVHDINLHQTSERIPGSAPRMAKSPLSKASVRAATFQRRCHVYSVTEMSELSLPRGYASDECGDSDTPLSRIHTPPERLEDHQEYQHDTACSGSGGRSRRSTRTGLQRQTLGGITVEEEGVHDHVDDGEKVEEEDDDEIERPVGIAYPRLQHKKVEKNLRRNKNYTSRRGHRRRIWQQKQNGKMTYNAARPSLLHENTRKTTTASRSKTKTTSQRQVAAASGREYGSNTSFTTSSNKKRSDWQQTALAALEKESLPVLKASSGSGTDKHLHARYVNNNTYRVDETRAPGGQPSSTTNSRGQGSSSCSTSTACNHNRTSRDAIIRSDHHGAKSGLRRQQEKLQRLRIQEIRTHLFSTVTV